MNGNMHYIHLTQGYHVAGGLPVKAIGPFYRSQEAVIWWNENKQDDWEGTIDVIHQPQAK